jgi:uncharacterized YccA/Bax inhibitor family protein
MLIFLATTAAHRRHLQEIGLVICGLGALAVLLSGAFGLRSMSRAVERSTMVVAGLLLGVGFLLQLLALHSSK